MKKIKILLFTVFSLLLSTSLIAQEKSISGTVTSKSDGGALPGVSVVVKNTTRGTETDFDGKYTIKASAGDVLTFSFVGMQTYSVIITPNTTTIDAQLEDGDNVLDEVVVTAFGIKKTRKSITYAAQDIKADELNKVKQTNPVNSLSGKIAGASITRSASGAGGSVKVLIRGNSSIGNNQPLYVVDGTPLNNPTSGQPGDTFGDINGGNRDGGDALSLINPDDIESLTVLKGASASALYGSAGSNGVILITTKTGKSGKFKVDFSSNLTVDAPAYMMDFSDAAQKNVDDFVKTGTTYINSFSISGGNENAQTYFSYSNTTSNGILPSNNMKQHTFNIKETAKLLDDKLKLTASVMGSTQNFNNRAVSGMYFNPLVGVYSFDPSAGKLSDYKVFEEYDVSRNIQQQLWYQATKDIEQNPYWITNRNKSNDSNQKLVSSLKLSYQVNDWLTLQTRGTFDKTSSEFERKIHATSEATLAPLTGRYILFENDFTQTYADILATINTKVNEDISLNVISGGSTTRNVFESFTADSGTTGGLQYANVFSIQNFNANKEVSLRQNSTEIRENSIFASATFGYKDKLFLDVTARNDWSSSLPNSNNSFFYPSIGLTGVLSELFKMNEKISFAKARISYAEVGSGFGANLINPNRQIGFGGASLVTPTAAFPGSTPKPERQKSFEIGTEWKFFNNKFGIDIGYYNTKTTDQYYSFQTSTAVIGAPNAYLNSGEISNKGIEISAFAVPVDKDGFKWTTNVNFAANKNEVVRIYDGQVLEGLIEPDFFTVSGKGVNTFGSYLVEGGSFGDIYTKVIKRDADGTPIYDNGGFIEDDSNLVDGLTKVGNSNPDFTLGWNNSFEFKNFTIDFLIDGKFGGETVSLTQSIVESLSNNSAREAANGDIAVVDLAGNESTISAQEYYGKAGGRDAFNGEYVYSATNVRLAELAIGYKFTLPEDSFFKNIKASLVGSNLFFFYKDAPHDPNVSLSTGNALQGVDVLGLPSTRSIGLNLNLSF
jgi:TonB-dependent SusC/RagA subfamily outer membrane receptor